MEAERTLLGEQRPVEQGGVMALPLLMVAPDAPDLAGVLVVRWNAPGNLEMGAHKGLALLAPACAVLLDRREQSLAHDAFLSLAVHELRSPLTAVKGYAQLLLRQARRLAVPPQTRQAIDAIEEQATRMADMISEMHDAVRIRRGDLELHPERADILPLVESAVQQQRRLYPQHAITLDAPDEPLVADVDPQRLTQVVAALVNNAARYSPGGGPVAVRVTSRSTTAPGVASLGEAFVCVQDAGIGIAPADRVHIFEYLYRAPDAKRRHLSGLGLGLFVSRSLVERMGGQLWLDQTLLRGGAAFSEQSGELRGSVFCFIIPLTPGE
jgi:signal transduction histidine kinase